MSNEKAKHPPAGSDQPPVAPGDEAVPGTEGAGQDICPECNGTGKKGGQTCPNCEGTGYITQGIGGA